jgi:predicted small secreted protein
MTRIALSVLALLMLAGCETVEGFGQDVENTGELIEEESREAQADL